MATRYKNYRRSRRYRYGKSNLRRRRNNLTKAYSGANAKGVPVNENGKRVFTKWNAGARLNGKLFGNKFSLGGGISQKIFSTNAEKKHIWANTSGTVSGTGVYSYHSLNPCAQGDAYNERIGKSIRMANLQIRLSVERNDDASTSQDTKCRLLLGIDKTCRTRAVPASDSILQDDSEWLSYRIHPDSAGASYLDTGRYTLLRDKKFTISKNSTSLVRMFDFNIPLDINTKYDGDVASTTTIQKNLLFIGLTDFETTYHVGYNLSWRITFYDD